MANKKTGDSKTAQAAAYKSQKKWESNRKRRLERTLKEQPNNKNIKPAMEGMVYRRRTPTNPTWSHSMIREARLFKEFTGKFHMDLFSKDPKAQAAAAQLRRTEQEVKKPQRQAHSDFGAFSIGTRLGYTSSKSFQWD